VNRGEGCERRMRRGEDWGFGLVDNQQHDETVEELLDKVRGRSFSSLRDRKNIYYQVPIL
jgi:hypothetical protein